MTQKNAPEGVDHPVDADSAVPQGVTTFGEDLGEMMRTITLAAGVPKFVVAGTVGDRFRAVYAVTGEEPPRVVEIAMTGHVGLTATVRIVGVAEDDTPTAEVGRHTYPLPESPEQIYDVATNLELTRRAQVGDAAMAAELFDSVYENLEQFVPDTQAPLF